MGEGEYQCYKTWKSEKTTGKSHSSYLSAKAWLAMRTLRNGGRKMTHARGHKILHCSYYWHLSLEVEGNRVLSRLL